jgi:hypothetical protein
MARKPQSNMRPDYDNFNAFEKNGFNWSIIPPNGIIWTDDALKQRDRASLRFDKTNDAQAV